MVEMMDPGDTDTVAARDLAAGRPVGHRRDLHRARPRRRGRSGWRLIEGAAWPRSPRHEIRLDVDQTWGCEYRFTERVLTGDPRV